MKNMQFRVWDKKEEKMYYEGFYVTPDGGLVWRNDALPDKDDYILMRSTGLKDNSCTTKYPKGRLMYERDWGRMSFFWRYKEEGGDGDYIEEKGYYEGQIVIIASAGVCIRNPIRHKWNLTKDTEEEILQFILYKRVIGCRTSVMDNPNLLETN